MGLQKFKIKTANTIISSDNKSLQSMATDQLFDLFSLEAGGENGENSSKGEKKKSISSFLEEMTTDHWDNDEEYSKQFNMTTYMTKT